MDQVNWKGASQGPRHSCELQQALGRPVRGTVRQLRQPRDAPPDREERRYRLPLESRLGPHQGRPETSQVCREGPPSHDRQERRSLGLPTAILVLAQSAKDGTPARHGRRFRFLRTNQVLAMATNPTIPPTVE